MTLDPSAFIKQQNIGVLSTHSVAEERYPFGSITPYIITNNGEIAIYISELAEHTKNIAECNKVSLTIFDIRNSTNPNDGPRLTILAEATQIQTTEQLKNIYLETFPDSEITLSLPGFSFYALKPHKARLVAGFGKVKWISYEQMKL